MRRREFIALMGGGRSMAARCDGAGAGADLSAGLFISGLSAIIKTALGSTNCTTSVLLKGQNLIVEFHSYGQHVDLIPQYAAELITAQVNVIAVAGDEAVRAVQQATKTIPIVGLVRDMLGSGLGRVLIKPPTNVIECYSITSSARIRDASGIVRPSALAVLRLMANSNKVGCSIGSSPGFSPRRIRATYPAGRRQSAAKFGP
jgi:hypothetical protein